MSEATAQFRNNGKYYEYHKDKSHTTKDCRDFANALAEIKKANPPQVNLINKQNPTKNIFIISGNSFFKK